MPRYLLFQMSYVNISVSLLLAAVLDLLPAPAVLAQSILPARPEAIGGGNPFEGLGRPDDPNPSRVPGAETGITNDVNLPPEPGTKSSAAKLPKKTGKQASHLVPPPPPVMPDAGSVPDDKNPMKVAIQAIKQKDYEKAQVLLSELTKLDPENMKALYLDAVVCVYRKQYLRAQEKYRRILDQTSDEELKKMAADGLKKLEEYPSGDMPELISQ